ncbi:hypothetical protein COOONC_25400, partial [Cooperia oncophora]
MRPKESTIKPETYEKKRVDEFRENGKEDSVLEVGSTPTTGNASDDSSWRRCVLEELRKAQGEPLTPEELFERCGGTKATNLSIDAFMAFVGQHCSRAVKAIHDAGDENSLPRYALHVDSSRKTGTLKRRAARSQSQSS